MRDRPTALLAGPPSDSHTWNLLYLQLLLVESGWAVRNLGSCTPVDMFVAESSATAWDLLVISSVNGHGFHEGLTLIRALQTRLSPRCPPAVIGGKLGIGGADHGERRRRLIHAGFLDVFEGDDAITRFRALLSSLAERRTVTPLLMSTTRS